MHYRLGNPTSHVEVAPNEVNVVLLHVPVKPLKKISGCEEIAEHSVTHLPHRSWCPVCVQGQARDRPHRRVDRSEHALPELHFDYVTRDEGETQAMQVMRDTKTGMMFAHHVPKKGMSNVHGAREIIKDVEKLGYDKIILRSDDEAALKSIRAEVARIREKETVLENSPVGDSKANGVAERAAHAFGEQFRVIREGLQQRLQVRIPGNHPLTSWMTEHSADFLNKCQCGEDGRTAYRRWKGKDLVR